MRKRENPADWPTRPLSSCVGKLNAGVSVNAEDRPHGAGELGVLKTSALSGGVFRPEENKAVLPAEQTFVQEPVRQDSVLISRMNTPALVGECCYVSRAYPTLFLPDRLWQVAPSAPDAVDMRWLAYVLRTPQSRRYIDARATGTSGSMKNLPKSALLNMRLGFPRLDEQRIIAHILDTLDTQIRRTEALIAKLEQIKQGLLTDLLTRGIDEYGELRPPPEEAPELYKESPLGRIPKDWEVSRGRRACYEIVVGIVIRPTQYYRDTGVPVLRSANVRENRLQLDDLAHMSLEHHKVLSKSAVRPGDVLTVRTGYPGTSCVVDESLAEANCVDIIISRPGPQLQPRFWALWINSDFGKGHVLRTQGGLAQQHFNVRELADMEFPLPSVEEQGRIVRAWSSLERRISQERTEVDKLNVEKAGLMDDLLTGRVRITPLLDESAQATG